MSDLSTILEAAIQLEKPDAVEELAKLLVAKVRALSWMLSDPDWGVGMLEDIADIVGMEPNPTCEARWERH